MVDRAVIIASGPSLTATDVDFVMGTTRWVYAVNDVYKLAPMANFFYACDEEWWTEHLPHIHSYGERWTTCEAAALRYNLHYIPGRHHEQFPKCYFDTTGDGIIYGGNSGFQCLNLAFAHGCRDVVLLGFDMGNTPGSKSHFFGDHPQHLIKPTPFSDFRTHFQHAAPIIKAAGMKVVNATRGGMLESFPRVALEDID